MRSLRLRLAVSLVLVSIVVVASVSVLLYRQVARQIREDLDRQLVADARASDAALAEGREPPAATWAVWDADGAWVAGVRGLAKPPASAALELSDDGFSRRASWTLSDGRLLAVAADTRPTESMITDLRRRFWLLGAAACVLLGGLVVWQVSAGFAPLWRLATNASQSDSSISLEAKELPIELRPFVTRFNELVERLRGALARERQFTGHVAHELRTPLAVLQTGLELAMRKEESGSEIHRRLDELLDTVGDMGKMVENLLMLARVEQGAETTQLQSVEIRPLVDSVWRSFAERAGERELGFENRLPKGHSAHGDPGKLLIVIQNLLGNAVSYTERGGSIAVEADEDEIVAVWDSGPQLGKTEIDRVFDRMWRADLARTDAVQHAGLGLSLVRALCRHMRMEVLAENVTSGGLRFVVTQRYRTG